MLASCPIRFSIITAMIVLATAIFTRPVMADPVTIQLGSLTGTVEPITYTIPAGTFTTSEITLTLNLSSPSFFVIDEATGVITAHTVIDVFFNNGRGVDLSGTVTVDETGILGPNPILMDITSGVLMGAGEFNGSTLFGINPIRIGDKKFDWDWGKPPLPPPDRIFIDLPSSFIGGDNIPTTGHAEATPVPESASLRLLATGLASIGAALCKRRRYSGRG